MSKQEHLNVVPGLREAHLIKALQTSRNPVMAV